MEDPAGKKAQWGLENSLKAFRVAGPLISLGIQLAAAVGFMCLLGYWLDRQWGTAPWMMVICTCFGFGAGMFHFIKTVNAVGKREAEERDAAKR